MSEPIEFSVLLPTRNGGRYIEACIESILAQADARIELIVSDNANEDETPAVLQRYADRPGVTIVRTQTVLSVTDNWNNAYRHARGEYVLMMGDDDLLLDDYFTRMRALLSRHGRPDCVVYNGYSYIAPTSVGTHTCSYYREQHFAFGDDFRHEALLTPQHRRGIVVDMFRFLPRIPLNMQTTLVKRAAAERIPGGFFQPPFPDHLALNALLLCADSWVFTPERFVVVGVSPKSFGHYVYSQSQQSGLAYLGISADFAGRLPGNELLNGMYVWLDALRGLYPDELRGITVDRPAYVRRQIYAWILDWRMGRRSLGSVVSQMAALSLADQLGQAASLVDRQSWRYVQRLLQPQQSSAERQFTELLTLDDVPDISTFARWAAGRA